VATRWRRWSRRSRPLLTVGGVTAIGIVAEWQGAGFRGEAWLPELAVGIGLAVSGALMKALDGRSRIGDLVALAGAVWFIPNFASVGITPLAWLAAESAALHRAVLVHAIVAFPSGRVVRPLEGLLVVVAYVSAMSDAVKEEAGAIVWAIAALVAFVAIVRLRTGPARSAGIRVLPTMVLHSLVIGGTGALLLIFGNFPAPRAIVHAYEAGLVAVSFVLLFNVYDHRSRLASVTDAAVELMLGPAGYVRELLANALRDPSVEVAFAMDDGGTTIWVDELGRHIQPLRATGSRAVVPVLVDGRVVVQLACESAVVDEPGLLPSIEAAARLAASNAQLQASLRAEAAALQASRLRLLSAADVQRIALADQLDRGAGASLAELGGFIDQISTAADPAVEAAVDRSRSRLAGLDAGLRSLSAGLGPQSLKSDGLEAALSQLGTGTDVRIEVDVRAEDLPDRLSATTYFICAEAISNALKHASASAITVRIRNARNRLQIDITDDGLGGASITKGSGLQGLADRASALGGSLAVTSPLGAGTRVTADLPIG
jgi:signal transduction histidine kinase